MNRRGFHLLLALVVLFAAVLRLWRIAGDLPDFLEEAIPFRRALDLWSWTGGRTDWNPHLFNYPSLTLYLHFFLQKLGWFAAHAAGLARTPADWFVLYLADPARMVLPARLLHVAFDGLAIAFTGLVAERLSRGAGVPAALLAALSPTLLGTSRAIFTDTVMGALALAALERMLAWQERGGAWRLGAAVVLVGLAAGAKYPAALVLAPLAWVLWSRARGRGLALWPLAAAGALAVFLLTTPYALLDFAAFRRDFGFESAHVASGHLGQTTGLGLAFHLRNLLRDLGPAGVVLLAGSVLLLVPSRTRVAALAAWLYLLVFFVPIAGARFGAERYLVPVIPVAAALATAAALEFARASAPRRRPAFAAVLLGVLLVPALISGMRAAAHGVGFTQVEARRWLEAHLSPRELVVEEAWGPAVPSVSARVEVEASPIFRAAGPEARRRYLLRTWFHVVSLPIAVSGRTLIRLQPPGGPPVDVDLFPAAVDLNRMAYAPRLFGDVDVFVTSSAVRGRFVADTTRYATACRLYLLLDSTATVLARIAPGRDVVGPELVVYRLGPAARAALAAAGPLDPLWWAEYVPPAYRRRATAVLEVPWEEGAPRLADGSPAPWVRSLTSVYDQWLRPFAADMALNLADLGRFEAARSFAEATLLLLPDDPEARIVRDACRRQRGEGAAPAKPR